MEVTELKNMSMSARFQFDKHCGGITLIRLLYGMQQSFKLEFTFVVKVGISDHFGNDLMRGERIKAKDKWM